MKGLSHVSLICVKGSRLRSARTDAAKFRLCPRKLADRRQKTSGTLEECGAANISLRILRGFSLRNKTRAHCGRLAGC